MLLRRRALHIAKSPRWVAALKMLPASAVAINTTAAMSRARVTSGPSKTNLNVLEAGCN